MARLAKPMHAMLANLLSLLLATTSAAPAVDVTLAPAGEDAWTVRYELSEPVPALVFARGNGGNRAATWTLDTPGLEIDRISATDRIVSLDGAAFDAVALTITGRGEKPAKDYAPFLAFSDGGVAVYTGQFIVGLPKTDEAVAFIDGVGDDNTIWSKSATLSIDRGAFARIVGDARELAGSATLPLDQGRYVYLGDATPVETDELMMIMDPGTPAWLRDHLQQTLADAFGWFTGHFGELPGGKPFLVASHRPLPGGQLSFNGGVIGNQVAIDMGLGADLEDSAENRLFLARFFVHESAHLWNNGLVTNPAPADAWIHEGAAEALAWLALLELGHDETDSVAARFSEAANQCVGFLGDGPLIDAHRRGAFGAFYSCGAVIALATHGTMQAYESDLAGFWRDLLTRAENAGGRYDADSYVFLLASYQPILADRLTRFIGADHPNPARAVTGLLEGGGVAVDSMDGELSIPALPDRRSRGRPGPG